jgi:hypothetical protein
LLVELSKKDLDKFGNDSYIKAKEISILVAYRYFQIEQKAKVHGSNFIFVDGDICEKNNLNNGKSIFLFETILELTSAQMKKVKNVHYRGTDQTVWKFNSSVFYQQLDKFGRWC